MFLNKALIVSISTILMVSCEHPISKKSHGNADLDAAIRIEQPFISLTGDELPGMNANANAARKYIDPLDIDSIEMFEYKGTISYHPVGMLHRVEAFIAAYNTTKEYQFLERATKYVEKLRSLALETDSLIFLPYRFRFAVHADSNNTFDIPWYSGMAQGQFLLVLTRLYEITGNEKYNVLAAKSLNSLARLKNSGATPWVSRIDSLGFFWIEEYPHESRPGMTLNGYIAAIYGLYDYYRVTKSQLAKQLYDLSLTTIKQNLPRYRVAGANSWYCLGHNHPATDAYHGLHMNMMFRLYTMTGDPFFLMMRDILQSDVDTR